MAYVDPSERSDGFIITPTVWNQDVVANVQALYSRVITGRVTSAGAITAGTGFSVNKSATGVYDVTYDTTQAAALLVHITPADATSPRIFTVTSTSTTGFTVKTFNTSSTATDCAFVFTARPVV